MKLSAKQVVFGCVTDSDPKFLDQAVRLAASLRWFGGSLAESRMIVCGVGGIPAPYSQILRRLNAELCEVGRFDARHGPSNKLRFLELPGLEDYEVVALLDCDTIIVQDIAPLLPSIGFAAKPADLPTVTPEQFQRIFERVRLPLPPRRYQADVSGALMLPYFNTGVCLLAKGSLAPLRESWQRQNRALLDLAESLQFPLYHTDQASLTVALQETGIPVTVLPSAMNFPVHLPPHSYPPHFQFIDPAVIHYHHLAAPRGGILPPPLIGAASRVRMFNERMARENLWEPAA